MNTENKKNELKMWVATFQYSDGESNKIALNRPHYYAVKEDVECLMDEINNDDSLPYTVTSFDIKENKSK